MVKPTDSVRIVLFDDDLVTFVALTEADDITNLKLPGGRLEDGESADEAAARELMEELNMSPEDARLAFAGELTNDDGVSKRYIYYGIVDASALRPSEEIYQIGKFSGGTVPEGKNKSHILSAVALARQTARSRK